jgi:hypothetical protein
VAKLTLQYKEGGIVSKTSILLKEAYNGNKKILSGVESEPTPNVGQLVSVAAAED